MKSLVSRFVKDESGATAIEYGLIAGLVSIVIIAGLAISRVPRLQAVFTDHWQCASGVSASSSSRS